MINEFMFVVLHRDKKNPLLTLTLYFQLRNIFRYDS